MKWTVISRELIVKTLEELKAILGITDKVKLELRPLKTKAASISIKKRVIRLNKYVVSRLDEVSLRYLILHELVHLKLGTIYHTKDFYETMYRVSDRETVRKSEERILASLIELNCRDARRAASRLDDLF
mgnify:CR=1 FL=1